jgi:hypothetical protein
MQYLVLPCKHNFKTIEKLGIDAVTFIFIGVVVSVLCHFTVQVLTPSPDFHMIHTWNISVQLTMRVVLQIALLKMLQLEDLEYFRFFLQKYLKNSCYRSRHKPTMFTAIRAFSDQSTSKN